MLSIKPNYADMILDGEKTVEYRKSCRCIKQGTPVLLYATAPVKAVVGHFVAGEILHAPPSVLWRRTNGRGGIDKRTFQQYFGDASNGTAIVAREPVRWPIPTPIDELGCIGTPSRPPRSHAVVDASKELRRKLARGAQ